VDENVLFSDGEGAVATQNRIPRNRLAHSKLLQADLHPFGKKSKIRASFRLKVTK